MADMERINEYQTRWKQLDDELSKTLLPLAKDISEFIAPNRGRFDSFQQEPDTSHNLRGSSIIDSHACDCLEIATNGLHSGLTPPSRPWFRLSFQDDGLNEYGPSKEWLSMLQTKTYGLLRASNFYSSIHSLYAEVLSFATACLYMEEDFYTGLLFRPFTFGEYRIATDKRGKVDTVYRKIQMTVKQMADRFGRDKLSLVLRNELDKSPLKTHEILHAVQPRKNRDNQRIDAKNHNFESMWILTKDNPTILRESGFNDFPFVAGRWLVVGNDVYGTDSPGIRKLPDTKMLQDMEESALLGTHREVDPPVIAPTELQGVPIRTNAGGITYYDSSDNKDGLRPLYQSRFNIAGVEAKEQQIRERISIGFYNNLFMMIAQLKDQTHISATQIMEMQAEKLPQLGPFIERMEDEILDPVVTRCCQIILENPIRFGMPMPPQEIAGVSFRIEYVSMLAQAQKLIGVKAIDETVLFAGQAAPIFPDVLDNIDIDEALRARADLVGTPARVVRGKEAVIEIRKAKAQQQESMMQMAAMQQGLTAAQQASQTPTDPKNPNLLTQLLGELAPPSNEGQAA
jgi:hypothetical protein